MMEIVLNLISLCIVGVFTYVFLKKGKEAVQAETMQAGTIDEALKKEKERIEKIQQKVTDFLQGASFFEAIGIWKEKTIYKYIFKNGFLYEFMDTMSDQNYRIGIDDDFLCFEQLSYKRLHNPSENILKKIIK